MGSPSPLESHPRCSGNTLEKDKSHLPCLDVTVTNIARPASVVMLAARVRAACDMSRRERIRGLKERVSDGGYAVSSKDLAQRFLATKV
jgi:anti-sigma28 factor (negative regulator of flagellin synthesis)